MYDTHAAGDSLCAPADTSRRFNLVAAVVALTILSPALLIVTGPRPILAALYFAVLGTMVLITNPRICFYVWMAAGGLFYPAHLGGMLINPADFAVLILLMAVVLDYLLRVRTEVHRTSFDAPFMLLIGAALMSIVLAHDRSLTITPTLRVIVIYLAYRVSYKMAREIGVRRIVQVYLLIVVVLAAINCVTLVIEGGQHRVFGLAWLPMETFCMTALPMAAAFLIRSNRPGGRLLYGTCCLVIGIAILGTQSRAPMVAVLVALPVLMWLVMRKAQREQLKSNRWSILWLAMPLAGLVLVVLTLSETAFRGSFERIGELINSMVRPEGTVSLRVVLWTAAIKAYLVNPITGIGMGNFKVVSQILPDIRLVPVWYYIGGMSPHNVVLHWLVETGPLGAGALLWLAWRGVKVGYRQFMKSLDVQDAQVAGALAIAMVVFALTIFYMRAWTWGQDGYIMALLFGLVAARQRRQDSQSPS